MREVRIYVEGGGAKDTKDRLRQAFAKFFAGLRDEARRKGTELRVIACGSRAEAIADFRIGLKANPNAFNLLLVDADEPVTRPAREHLAAAGQDARYLASVDENPSPHRGAISFGDLEAVAEPSDDWFLSPPAEQPT